MFKIVVRSHARSSTLLDQTLALLRQQQELDLSKSLYLALHRDDVPEYERALKDFPHAGFIVGSVQGCHSRTTDACEYFPEGEPLLCLDDDLMPGVEWKGPPATSTKVPWTNLSSYARDGFESLRRGYAGIFGVRTGLNAHWKMKDPWKEASPKPVFGNFWGVFNDRMMLRTAYGHQEDNVRSARYLARYGNSLHYHWLGMPTVFDNPGGMQSPTSKDRGHDPISRIEVTRAVCEAVLREEKDLPLSYYPEPKLDSRWGFYTLKARPSPQIRKRTGNREVWKWSSYFQPSPDP